MPSLMCGKWGRPLIWKESVVFPGSRSEARISNAVMCLRSGRERIDSAFRDTDFPRGSFGCPWRRNAGEQQEWWGRLYAAANAWRSGAMHGFPVRQVCAMNDAGQGICMPSPSISIWLPGIVPPAHEWI